MASPDMAHRPDEEIETAHLYKLQVRNAVQYAIFVISTNGIIKTWNQGVGAILGFSEDEWVGQPAFTIYTPFEKRQEVCMSELDNAEANGFSANIRWHHCKDGHEIFCHGYMTALRDDEGNLLGFSKILSDETHNKQLQDALTESNTALEYFAALASHDLREPLRSLSAITELFNRTYRDSLPAGAADMLDQMMDGATQMGVQIQNMLDFSQLTHGKERPQSYSLDQDIETALTKLSAAIKESNASITHDSLPQVKVDQGQMVRLFQNLISNALKYKRQNVRPTVHVSCKLNAGMWTVTVADNGMGFEPSVAEEIFIRGNRLRPEDSDRPGYGFGLAACRQIVEGHGGRIWAESKPNVGSKFHFTLPVTPNVALLASSD